MSLREMLRIARAALADPRIPAEIEKALALGETGDVAALRTVEIWLLAEELPGLPASVAAHLVDAVAGDVDAVVAVGAVESWLAASEPMAASTAVRAEVRRRLEAARAAHRPIEEQRRDLARDVVSFARESMVAARQSQDPRLLASALAATTRAFDVLEPVHDDYGIAEPPRFVVELTYPERPAPECLPQSLSGDSSPLPADPAPG
jgi:hypothetical protein